MSVLWRRLLAATAALVLVASCDADVATVVNVDDSGVGRTSVTVTLTGEIADVVAGTDLEAQLSDTFARRTGVEPEKSREGDRLLFAADVAYERLGSVADITGVAAISVAPVDGEATTQADLVEPGRLVEVISDAAATQPDRDALLATLLASTTVTFEVAYDGGVESADGPVTPAVDDGTATFTRALDDPATGPVTVVGRTSSPGSALVPAAVTLAAVAAAAGAIVWMRRRNISDRTPR